MLLVMLGYCSLWFGGNGSDPGEDTVAFFFFTSFLVPNMNL